MTLDADSILATLTLEQKISLLAGADNWHTVALPGVPSLRCSDGPAGVRGTSWTGPASASFPCGTALGASFDPELVQRVGAALGDESRSKGAHVLLAPTVNLHRTPIGGRNFECMSEDPLLTARVASAYVRGVQSRGVACCIKHFAGNDTEFNRMTIDSVIDERTLREMYLVPFEEACRSVADGGAGVKSIMTGYNRLNGEFCSESKPLLRGVLRGDWAWDGVVFSDWFGTHSAAESLEAGLDLEMPGPPRERGQALVDAVRAGRVAESRVDESVRRLLDLFEWCGVTDTPGEEVTEDSAATRAVIREAAVAGSVLLRNEARMLPLSSSASVALIGPNSERGQIQGGGSARVRANRPVGLLDALVARGVSVAHEPGCRIGKRLPVLRGAFDVTFRAGDGFTASDVADQLAFLWQDDPAEGIPVIGFAATVTGTFTPAAGGEWQFGLTAVGPAVLKVDGAVVSDLSTPQTGGAYFGMGSPEIRGTVELTAGKPVAIELECSMFEGAMLRGVQVGALPVEDDGGIDRAVVAASAADIAVVVVGTDANWETEGEDRTSMDLPGDQDELIRRVAAVNPRTVVVINAGSPVTMPWIADVAAVLQVWFPGEEFGNAVADMLLGAVEPGGRLPITISQKLADTPAHRYYPGDGVRAEYGEGSFIGYRWYVAQGIEPAFAFGHGLGYTEWEFAAGSITAADADDLDDGVTIVVPVANVGSRSGSTVVQCYLAPPDGDPARPPLALAGFAKVTLDADQQIDVGVHVPHRAFAVWSVETHQWVVPGGEYRLLVGPSSVDLTPAGIVSL